MSGGSKGQQTSTVTQKYSPEEAAARARAMAEAERIYGITSAAVPGLAPKGPSADTLQAQEMARGVASGPMTQMASTMPWAMNFGMRDVLDINSNPALQQTLDTATRRVGQAYTDPGGVISRIGNKFDATNTGGISTREGIAGGIAGREYLNTIGDVTGRITGDAYAKGLDTFSRTTAMAPAMMNSMLMPASTVSAVGRQGEAYDEMARQWQLNAPWAALMPYASTIQGLSSPSTETVMPGAKSNPFMAAMGGAAMGAAATGGNPYGAAAGGAMGLLFS